MVYVLSVVSVLCLLYLTGRPEDTDSGTIIKLLRHNGEYNLLVFRDNLLVKISF